MRVFRLVRHEDPTGVSGTGIVAEGVEFSDGTCVLRWRGPICSTAVYASLSDLEVVHSHHGATEVVMVADNGKRTKGEDT